MRALYLLVASIILFQAGDVASAGCPRGLLPGVQLWEAELCGAGVFFAIETGPIPITKVALVSCAPLAIHGAVNFVGGKLCDFSIEGASNLIQALENQQLSDNNQEKVDKVIFNLVDNRGYTDEKGLHCIYVNPLNGDEIEQIFPPYNADEWSNKIPKTLICRIIEKSTTDCIAYDELTTTSTTSSPPTGTTTTTTTITTTTNAEELFAAWDKTFGGKNMDWGHSIRQTLDGGYIIVGCTQSYGDGYGDLWLIKTDPEGNKLWDRTFGGPDDMDEGSDVQQTLDGGYIITGSTRPDGELGCDVWLIKIDAEGNKLWDRTFGGPADADSGSGVQQTLDGGYIIVGLTQSSGEGYNDVWLIKTDAEGNKLWDKTFGGQEGDEGKSVQQTVDGGYIIVGSTYSYGSQGEYLYKGDVWLIKTDAEGNKVWDKTFGGSEDDYGSSVQQTPDGGYIVVGGTGSYGAGNEDVWLIKTDAEGNKVWDKTFGGSDPDGGLGIQQIFDGGYIIIGYTSTYLYFDSTGGYYRDIWLIKIEAKANT